jgi:hypothetical protein
MKGPAAATAHIVWQTNTVSVAVELDLHILGPCNRADARGGGAQHNGSTEQLHVGARKSRSLLQSRKLCRRNVSFWRKFGPCCSCRASTSRRADPTAPRPTSTPRRSPGGAAASRMRLAVSSAFACFGAGNRQSAGRLLAIPDKNIKRTIDSSRIWQQAAAKLKRWYRIGTRGFWRGVRRKRSPLSI